MLACLGSKYMGPKIEHLAASYPKYQWQCWNYSQKEPNFSLKKCSNVKCKLSLLKIKVNHRHLGPKAIRHESKTAVPRYLFVWMFNQEQLAILFIWNFLQNKGDSVVKSKTNVSLLGFLISANIIKHLYSTLCLGKF